MLDDWSGWRKVGTIAAAVHNAVLMLGAMNGKQIPKESWKTPSDFIPEEKAPPAPVDDETLTAQLNVLRNAWCR